MAAPAAILPILVKIPIFTMMFALGLSLRGDAWAVPRRRPWLLVRALVGSCVLVPLVALVLFQTPLYGNLTPSGRFGIALMAICPSAPLTLRKAGIHGGDRELAALLQVGAAVAAISTVPLLADLFRLVHGVEGWNIEPRAVAAQVGLVQLLPLGLGLLARRWRPELAERLAAPLGKVASLLLLALFALVLLKTLPALVPFVRSDGYALLVMAILVVAALAIGFLLAGPDPRERTTVSLVTSMRNPGLAMLFATLYAPEMPSIRLAILVYLLLTLLLSAPYLRLRRRRQGLQQGLRA